MTRFSIIVPTYNSESTLQRTLESIRDQKWINTEVIIVDGASSDQTLKLVKTFIGLEIVVISEPDKGIYDAINKGVSLSTGDLICVIGSDDRLAKDALLKVDEVWRSDKSDIVAGKALLESPSSTPKIRTDESFGLGALVSGIPFCHNSMYVTPEAYSVVGVYNLHYRICADAEWVHRAICAGCTCSRIDQVLVHFSQSGVSSTNDSLIMQETYSIIAGNFPGLSVEDAEILFKAIRRWTDDSKVAEVLKRNASNMALIEAVMIGLSSFSSVQAMHPMVVAPFLNKKSRIKMDFLRKIISLFHFIFIRH